MKHILLRTLIAGRVSEAVLLLFWVAQEVKEGEGAGRLPLLTFTSTCDDVLTLAVSSACRVGS